MRLDTDKTGEEPFMYETQADGVVRVDSLRGANRDATLVYVERLGAWYSLTGSQLADLVENTISELQAIGVDLPASIRVDLDQPLESLVVGMAVTELCAAEGGLFGAAAAANEGWVITSRSMRGDETVVGEGHLLASLDEIVHPARKARVFSIRPGSTAAGPQVGQSEDSLTRATVSARLFSELCRRAMVTPPGPGDRVLVDIPADRASERWAHLGLPMTLNAQSYLPKDQGKAIANCREVRPTLVVGATDTWSALGEHLAEAVSEAGIFGRRALQVGFVQHDDPTRKSRQPLFRLLGVAPLLRQVGLEKCRLIYLPGASIGQGYDVFRKLGIEVIGGALDEADLPQTDRTNQA